VSTFVKVMQKKPWPPFFRIRCTLNSHNHMQHSLATGTDPSW